MHAGTRIFYDAFDYRPCGLLVAVYDGKNKILLDNLGAANGIAWSVDEKYFYIADTAASEIYSFDYDAKNIEVCQ